MENDDEETGEHALLQAIIESVPLRLFWKDQKGCFLGCNTRFAKDAGFQKPSDLVGKTDFDMGWNEEAERYRSDDFHVMASGIEKLDYEEPQTTLDGQITWLRTSKVPLRNVAGDVIGILSIYEEITELKQAQEAQTRLNRALLLLSACNSALIHIADEQALLTEICRLVVEVGGYRLAWVGFAEDDDKKLVCPVAQYGAEGGYLESVHVTWEDDLMGRGPMGTSIRIGTTQVNMNFLTDPRMAPWREQALQRNFNSNIALPLKDGDVTFGSLAIYATETDAFNEEETRLLEELANDLAYGIKTLRTRQALDKSRKQVVESLEGVIQVIAATVEARDPYTAGHQKRVAALGVAIAKELGLSQDHIHGLYLAAMIHDLGKIHLPAEILSKPTTLTPIERELVKTHSQIGYDILKDMKFPWPIADMVLQHHERMDGSGYPQGLKGDAILVESRILGVSDVVDAMASLRPYRAALGLEAAMNELKHYRDIKYDSIVVDACIQVLVDKRIDFEG